MATIYIKKDEVYRTRIEDITNENQFFYPVYQQARDSLQELLHYTNQFWKEQFNPNASSVSLINPMRLRGYPNNIIAFCADRGHGKTSAMLSFATALTSEKKDGAFWQNFDNINQHRFYSLEPIDPTVLENTDHIIPTIISRMFTSFTHKVEQLSRLSTITGMGRNNSSPRELREKQQHLLKLFQDCYRLADEQKDSKKRNESYDDLQLLSDRGDSSNFKVRFWELVKEYLQFIDCGTSPIAYTDHLKAFLIIQIDDADMNPDHAYDVVEDLRKYCVLPNVVILFATNLDQLEMCVEQHFVKSFSPLITIGKKTSVQHCHQTTVSYMDKLIPSMHRVNLPNINYALQNYGHSIYLYHDQFHVLDQEPEEYQSALISILWDRCRLRLQAEGDKLHPFLPSRMRELTHFLNRMSSLEVVGSQRSLLRWAAGIEQDEYTDDAVLNLKKNLEYLLDYLVHDWSDLALEDEQRQIIREIHRAATNHKLECAVENIQKYNIALRISAAPGSATPSQAETKWDELIGLVTELYTKEMRQFACAIELYFAIMQELILISSCIAQQKKPDSDQLNSMHVSLLGSRNGCKHSINSHEVMIGCTCKLSNLCKNINTTPTDYGPLTDFFNFYLHVSDNKLNPEQKSISTLINEQKDNKIKEEIELVFDPFCFSDLDWNTLYSVYSQDDTNQDYKHMLDFSDARLSMLSNISLQVKLLDSIKNKEKTYRATQEGWVHFRDRVSDLWMITNELCFGLRPTGQKIPYDALDWIFLSNENYKTDYLSHVYDALNSGSDFLDDLLAICEKISEQITDFNNLLKDEPVSIYDTLLLIYAINERVISKHDLLNTPLTSPFYSIFSDIRNSLYQSNLSNQGGTSKELIPKESALELLNSLFKQFSKACDTWKKLLSETALKDTRKTQG